MHKILKNARFYEAVKEFEAENNLHVTAKQLDKLESMYLSTLIYDKDIGAKEYFKIFKDELLIVLEKLAIKK